MTNSPFKSIVWATGLALGLLLFSFQSLAAASTPTPPPRPGNYVVDLAGVIRPEIERGLNSFLADLEAKTTAQAIILTVKSLDGEDIEGFSLRIAEQWKLGRKDKDNGLLFTVAIDDRKYRIEVGYGLEGVLPDSFVGSIGREHLGPHFRKGDYSAGIAGATLAIIGRIAESAEVEITGMERARRSAPPGAGVRKKPTLVSLIFTVIFIIGAIILFIKNPRLFMFILIFSMMGGRSRGGGWSGGGGFGGGGGGGFGGGGASGGW